MGADLRNHLFAPELCAGWNLVVEVLAEVRCGVLRVGGIHHEVLLLLEGFAFMRWGLGFPRVSHLGFWKV